MLTALAALALAATALPVLTVERDARGVLAVRVGPAVMLTELGVSVVKPAWEGTHLDQRTVAADRVRTEREDGRSVTTLETDAGAGGIRVRQTIVASQTRVDIDVEVSANRETPIETVMLDGLIPAAGHAGRTRWMAADVIAHRGVLPAETRTTDYILAGGAPFDWIGLSAPDGAVMRIRPRGAEVQLQDNRKWDAAGFGLMLLAGSGKLAPGKPVRLGVTLEASTAEQLERDVAALGGVNVKELKLSDSRPLAVGRPVLSAARVKIHGKLEIAVDVAARYDNPFDPDQIAVDAEIVRPDGRKVTAPGFVTVPMRVQTRSGVERTAVDGRPGFRVRFTPTVSGKHTVTVVARDRSGRARSTPASFVAFGPAGAGFVRVSSTSAHYFATDDGKPYFAVGENMCWSGPRAPLADYAQWLAGLGAAGGNWARLWLAFNEKGLEWCAAPTPKAGTGTYSGLGRYALDNAWRLDQVTAMAERAGVRLMFCIGTYGEFTEGGYFGEGAWVSNPYNARNGGPCAKPEDFWTHPVARKLYKRRLRYLVARWGYSPSLFAWEFWNEVPPTKEQAAWVAEMAAYLKSIDPNKRLVSTTYGNADVWRCPSIDFTMTHMYGQAGNTSNFTDQIVAHARDGRGYGKPYILAEFGIDWQTADSRWDPKHTGVNMHNGAWAAMMAGGAGTAMLWYWDGYVHPGDLYKILTPVRKFADTIDWTKGKLAPVADVGVAMVGGDPETFAPLTIPCTVEWGVPASTVYTLLRDGTVRGGPIAMTVGSPMRQPGEVPTRISFRVDLPAASTVKLRLGSVCTGARLVVKVDGKVLVDRPLKAGPAGAGPWKASKLLTQYNCWVSDYDEDIGLDLGAGQHTIEVANTEGDWLQIRSISLPAYRSSRYANVDALGIGDRDRRFLWVHHRESTWRADYDGKPPAELRGVRVSVPAEDGAWSVEWWDAWTGSVLQRLSATATGGTLVIDAPPFARDLALRCIRDGAR